MTTDSAVICRVNDDGYILGRVYAGTVAECKALLPKLLDAKYDIFYPVDDNN